MRFGDLLGLPPLHQGELRWPTPPHNPQQALPLIVIDVTKPQPFTHRPSLSDQPPAGEVTCGIPSACDAIPAEPARQDWLCEPAAACRGLRPARHRQEFPGHFERRKVATGTCGRAFATPCTAYPPLPASPEPRPPVRFNHTNPICPSSEDADDSALCCPVVMLRSPAHPNPRT